MKCIPLFICLILWHHCHAADPDALPVPRLPLDNTDQEQVAFVIEIQTPHDQNSEEQESPSIPLLDFSTIPRNQNPQSTGSIRKELMRSVQVDTPHTAMQILKKYEKKVTCNRTKDDKGNNLFQIALLQNIELADFIINNTLWQPQLSHRNNDGQDSYELIVEYGTREPREFTIKLSLVDTFDEKKKKQAFLKILESEPNEKYKQSLRQKLLDSNTLNAKEDLSTYCILLGQALNYCISHRTNELESVSASEGACGSIEDVGSWTIQPLTLQNPRPSVDRSISIKIKEFVSLCEKSPRKKKEIIIPDKTPPFATNSEPSSSSSSTSSFPLKRSSSSSGKPVNKAVKLLSLLRRNKSDVTATSTEEKSKDKEKKKKGKGKEKE